MGRQWGSRWRRDSEENLGGPKLRSKQQQVVSVKTMASLKKKLLFFQRFFCSLETKELFKKFVATNRNKNVKVSLHELKKRLVQSFRDLALALALVSPLKTA